MTSSKTLYSLMGNSQKLDGGAMFGNVPKALWQRWVEVDEQNRIDLCCRALLVIDGDKKILFETGIGAFFDPKMRERFGVQESEHILLQSLAAIGLTDADIDIVVLSHLHFDHAGGLLKAWSADSELELLFPNAQFVVGKDAWQRAESPHPRDRASYIPGLTDLMKQTGRLTIVEQATHELLGDDYRFSLSQGHTPGMLLSTIAASSGPIVFAADLIPGTPWVHLPITMGYDRFPEGLIDEKTELLESLYANDGSIFFTHDPKVAMGKVSKDEKGRFSTKSNLEELLELTI